MDCEQPVRLHRTVTCVDVHVLKIDSNQTVCAHVLRLDHDQPVSGHSSLLYHVQPVYVFALKSPIFAGAIGPTQGHVH